MQQPLQQQRWEYLVITLPAAPYLPPNAPKDAEPRTATDVLNDWGGMGWECVGPLAPYEVLFKRPLLERYGLKEIA
jgi:hypothetical protein